LFRNQKFQLHKLTPKHDPFVLLLPKTMRILMVSLKF
jgi:hypothetical protein